MQTNILTKIQFLEEELEKALSNNNFAKTSELSTNLENSVKELVNNLKVQSTITKKDVELLENLRNRIDLFEKKTATHFKNFTGTTSIQRKMHNAYKKYGV